ncbi:MAG: glycogen synthase [Chloroflexi bacterium]|nr:glycogen synthase [Chloroflexota bacterium]
MSERPLRILFALTEAAPLAKVGGLADVAGSLPQALLRRGHDVRLIMPRYASIPAEQYPILGNGLAVPIMGRQEPASLRQATLNGGVPVYLVDNAMYFQRQQVYGEPDDLERFTFFSQSVLEALKQVGWQPDIVHGHDWHVGLVIALMAWGRATGSPSSLCGTVFTIHNLAYQGWFDGLYASRAGLTPLLPSSPPLGSLMALGIYHADVVSTVSPTYAREILTPQYGEGLDPLLRSRQERLHGIINGLDYSLFDPASDARIPAGYDASTIERKALNKAALQKRMKLAQSLGTPLLGMVGRLAGQKGLDILPQAVEPLLAAGKVQIVLLGSGEPQFRPPLEALSARYPDRVANVFAFDLEIAQWIYAGADMFLMPSRYEPCGLGQLIAMRYGTIPVVRRTGGLADSVPDAGPDLGQGTGFAFDEYTPGALQGALERAVAAYAQPKAWHGLQRRAMAADYSWEASAAQYERMYRTALSLARPGAQVP